MKICDNCGSKYRDDLEACPNCGQRPKKVIRRVETPREPRIVYKSEKGLSRKEHATLGAIIGTVLGMTVALALMMIFLRNNTPAALPVDNGPGALQGHVVEASDRVTPVAAASVQVLSGGDPLAENASGEDGGYVFALNPGEYGVHITADGYITFNTRTDVQPSLTTYLETLLIAGEEGMEGSASGQIVDSVTGQPMQNASLTFNKDWNSYIDDESLARTAVATATTDAEGKYSVNLPLGYYTVIVKSMEYLTSTFNIIVQQGMTAEQNGTITPIVSAEATGDYLITLTWGEMPRDLDSHMVGPRAEGGDFHVYFSDKTAGDGDVELCSLDYDDTTSYGPEHVTLKPTGAGPYYYYVHRYSSDGSVATSGAKITVHQGNTLIREFDVPFNQGGGIYWNVFAIKDGQLIVKNTITDTPDTGYAG